MTTTMPRVVAMGLAVLVCLLSQTTCQNLTNLTEAERLAIQEEDAQPQYNVTYVFAVAHRAPIRQLDLTDAEARAVCYSTVWGGLRFKAHPKTCSAYVECVTFKKNPFVLNTVYRSHAYIRANAEQTFWNQDISAAVLWNTINNCDTDPCKTGKAITDGRSCYSYIVCKKNSTSNTAEGYQQLECPKNQSFDVATGACVSDQTCQKPPEVDPYTDLYCNASVPAVLTPGLPLQAYYNRTYLDNVDGKRYTVETFCPAGLVFNSLKNGSCDCVPQNQINDSCPKTLFSYGSQASSGVQQWSTVTEECNAVVNETAVSSSTYKWVHLRGSEFDCFHASALANNELAGSFTLLFSFLYEGSSTGTVALVSNSRDRTTCPTATLRVFMSIPKSSIVAEATNVNGVTVTVEAAATNLSRRVVAVRLERRSDGKLYLSVDNNTSVVSSTSLDNIRLKSTSCGLFLAKNNGLDTFVGYMNNFSLTKNC